MSIVDIIRARLDTIREESKKPFPTAISKDVDSPPIGSMESVLLMSRVKNKGPANHPYNLGRDAYGKVDIDEDDDPIGNPYSDGSWEWWMWYSGYHQERRDSDDRLEGDAA